MDWNDLKHLLSPPVRGNSKYHYYGLRIKAGSSLLRLMEDQQHLAMRQQPFSQKQRYFCDQPHISVLTSPVKCWWFAFRITHAFTALLSYMCAGLLSAQIIFESHKRKSQKVTPKPEIFLRRSPDYRDMQLNTTSSQDVRCQFSLTILQLTDAVYFHSAGDSEANADHLCIYSVYSLESHTNVAKIRCNFFDHAALKEN